MTTSKQTHMTSRKERVETLESMGGETQEIEWYDPECSCGWVCPHGGHISVMQANGCADGHIAHALNSPVRSRSPQRGGKHLP